MSRDKKSVFADDAEAHGNVLRIVECASWDEFIARLRTAEQGCVYRGQSDPDWKLDSPWHREVRGFLTRIEEREADGEDLPRPALRAGWDFLALDRVHKTFIHELSLVLNEPLDAKDPRTAWIIGRHHGLLTPLLDWTRSPFIAAFHAVSDRMRLPGPSTRGVLNPDRFRRPIAVWRLNVSAIEDRVSKEDIELIDALEFPSARQAAQRGVFTWIKSQKFLDLVEVLESKQILDALVQYLIPGRSLQLAMSDLGRMNITYATVFPDVEGVVKEANFAVIRLLLDTWFSNEWNKMFRQIDKEIPLENETWPFKTGENVSDQRETGVSGDEKE